MGMVAITSQVASAFFVLHRRHGDVTHLANDRDVSRQRVDREAVAVVLAIDGAAAWVRQEELASQLAACRQQVASLEERLRYALVVDPDRMAEFASLA